MSIIHNPVIRGFNPDPSILRVGDDYYIAVSSFEWLPAVIIYHSKDLAHWTRISTALPNLDLRGIVDSGGIWAPSLSHSDGHFWLIYTIVRGRVGAFKDVANYLVTSDNIEGPWSEPIFLNATGFDPSLFHDDDGRKWLVNMEWDYRKNHPSFGGIVLQEYDHAQRRLVGSAVNILRKSVLIEGPNVYKRAGRYYLLLAEGGTGWNHGISMARSNSIDGPYELDPFDSVMTTRGPDGAGDPNSELQKAGHGELVQTPAGDWYLAHLASRPTTTSTGRYCITGRETCLQQVVWTDDGWLRLAAGGLTPKVTLPGLEKPPASDYADEPELDHFDSPVLSLAWSSLRQPVSEDWASLSERPGWLRLRGRESMHSWFDQSLIAKRLTETVATAETAVEFQPEDYTQMAGLICWYDTRTHYYLRITHAANGRIVLGIILTDDGRYDEIESAEIDINGWTKVYLRAVFSQSNLNFYYSADGESWLSIGPTLDAFKLSDDYGSGLHFTGAMVGICVQDLSGFRRFADFDYFSLRNGVNEV